MQRLIILLVVFFASCGSPSPEPEPKDPSVAMAAAVDSMGLRGVVVVLEGETGAMFRSDSTRAYEPFIPASTFKIPNAMIALQEGVVKSATADTFRWDGQERSVAAWNMDHTLASGLQQSVVWLYQEVARRVGQERYDEWLKRLDYGNADAGGGVDLFWLTGDLRISAVEQVEFLRRFDLRELPFDRAVQDTVMAALNTDSTQAYVLRHKTGWAEREGMDDIGWLVGVVEVRDGRHLYLALNIDMPDASYAAKRVILARTVLQKLTVDGESH